MDMIDTITINGKDYKIGGANTETMMYWGNIKMVDLSDASFGFYNYTGGFQEHDEFKTIDIDVSNIDKINIVGTTRRMVCLYHLLNKSGDIVRSHNREDKLNGADETFNLQIDLTDDETTLRVSFLSSQEAFVYLFDNINIVHQTGNSKKNIMSQKAVTDGFSKRYTIHRRIRCVGMSIWAYDGQKYAGGYRGDCIARGYQTLLKQRYDFDSISNYCYSGNSLGGLTDGDTNSIMNKSSSWQGSKGDLWLLDTITNDFKRNIPIGTFADNFVRKTGITTYYGALKVFEEKVRQLSGDNYKIVVANALRRNNDGYTSTSVNAVGHTLLDYERALLNVASWNNWLFVDQYRCDLTDEAIEWATIDGLHLNNFGYNLAIRPWYECLDTLIEKTYKSIELTVTNGTYIDGDPQHGTVGKILQTVSDDWQTSNYIPVSFYEKYRYVGRTDIEGAMNVACVYGYDSSYKPIKSIIPMGNGSHGVTFEIPDGVAYIAICGYRGAGENLSLGIV